MGEHKDYGLSIIIEILSSALQSGIYLFHLSGFHSQGKVSYFRVCHFFMAINIENFMPIDTFKENVRNIIRVLRASRKALR